MCPDLLDPDDGAPRDPTVGALLGGTYQLERVLSESRSATVFLARQLRLDRPVAVKCLSSALLGDTAAMARFRREGETVSQLRHPHLVEFVDYDQTEEGVPFLVFEYLSGETLATRMRREGPLPPAVAVELACQVASGLELVHQHGIVHRDVKPSNVLVLDVPGRPFCKLLDFGVCRTPAESGTDQAPQSSVTGTFELLGTPRYMPPEQCTGAASTVDARGDQYSLAVVLYEALTGTHPSGEAEGPALFRRIAFEPSTAPSARGVGVPVELDTPLLRALAKRPADRFASMLEFSAALRAALGLTSLKLTPATGRAPVALPPAIPTPPPARDGASVEAPRGGATPNQRQRSIVSAHSPTLLGGPSRRPLPLTLPGSPARPTETEPPLCARETASSGRTPRPPSTGAGRYSSISPRRPVARTAPVGTTEPSPGLQRAARSEAPEARRAEPSDPLLAEDLDRARSELLLGNHRLALCYLRAVIERAGGGGEPGARAALEEATRMLRRVLDRYGSLSARVMSVRRLPEAEARLALTPEDAYLLAQVEVGMTLDDLASVSPLSEPDTLCRVAHLLDSGIISAAG